MSFILVELNNGNKSEIIPTRLIEKVRAKEEFDANGRPLPHNYCYLWLEGDPDPLLVNHSLSAMRDKLGAS